MRTVMLVLLGASLAVDVIVPVRNATAMLGESRALALGQPEAVALLGPKLQREALQSAPLREALGALRALPEPEKRASLLYIPKSTTTFWGLPAIHCYAVPFYGPALTGIALVDGLPAPGCTTNTYGYTSYGERDTAGPLAGQGLCERVRGLGFSQVFVASGSGGGELTRVACGPAPAGGATAP